MQADLLLLQRRGALQLLLKKRFLFSWFFNVFGLNPDHLFTIMTGIIPFTLYIEEKKLFICSNHACSVSECNLLRFLLRYEEICRHFSSTAMAASKKGKASKQRQSLMPGMGSGTRTLRRNNDFID